MRKWVVISAVFLMVTMVVQTTAMGDCSVVQSRVVRSSVVANKVVVPEQKIIVQNLAATPVIITVPVDSHAVPIQSFNVPFYYSASDAFSLRSAVRETIREEIKKLKEELKIRDENESGKRNEEENGNGFKVSDLGRVFGGAARCFACHADQDPPAGGFRLATRLSTGEYKIEPLSPGKKWMVYGAAAGGWMPPSASSNPSQRVRSDHLEILRRWAEAE